MIPTTIDLVGITDIIQEDPLVSSVICENNTLEALPISAQYNSFVKSPTGIIEKLTGHRSYRVDLTKPIQDGKSWQLPIAIAHIFQKNNILSFSKEKQFLKNMSDQVIWASGTINAKLDIKKINYVDQKIQHSIEFFKSCIKSKVFINLVMSIENKEDLNNALEKHQFLKNAVNENKIKIILIKSLYDLFDHLNLKNFLKKNIKTRHVLKKRKFFLSIFSIVFIASLVLLMISNIWTKTSPLISLNEKKKYSILLTTLKTYRYGDLTERVVAYIYDYIQTIQSDEINKQMKLNFISYSETELNKKQCSNKSNFIESVCNLNLEIINTGKGPVFIWALKMSNYNSKNNINNKTIKKSDIVNGMIQGNEAFLIDLQNNQEPIKLFIVYSKVFDIKIIDWLKNVDRENSLLETTIKRLKSLGYGFTISEIKNVKLIQELI